MFSYWTTGQEAHLATVLIVGCVSLIVALFIWQMSIEYAKEGDSFYQNQMNFGLLMFVNAITAIAIGAYVFALYALIFFIAAVVIIFNTIRYYFEKRSLT